MCVCLYVYGYIQDRAESRSLDGKVMELTQKPSGEGGKSLAGPD